jgi:quercetin dioxygenase-like cupin family protein
MKWEPNPRVPGLGVARIISKGTEAGAYVYRVKFPKGRVVQAHSHPDDRTYTVLEGTWYIGWGEKFDESKLIALTPGSFYTEPSGVAHFVATPDGEAIVQEWVRRRPIMLMWRTRRRRIKRVTSCRSAQVTTVPT